MRAIEWNNRGNHIDFSTRAIPFSVSWQYYDTEGYAQLVFWFLSKHSIESSSVFSWPHCGLFKCRGAQNEMGTKMDSLGDFLLNRHTFHGLCDWCLRQNRIEDGTQNDIWPNNKWMAHIQVEANREKRLVNSRVFPFLQTPGICYK